MNVLDLFSGIGGFSLGLERAGMRTVAFCEIDPYCRAVLAKHWPHVQQYDDVRTLTAERLAADGISVDVICGGFPCQDISFAGKGAGVAGERSGLWREYARLIGELRPRYVVVENVSALLCRGLATVLGDLAALGFDAEWHCIPASAVGAPHRRDRIWIIAHTNSRLHAGELDGGRARTAKSRGEGGNAGEGQAPYGQWIWTQLGASGEAVADASGERCREAREFRERQAEWPAGSGEILGDANGSRLSFVWSQSHGADWEQGGGVLAANGWWLTEPDVGRVAHGVPARVDRLRALGNAVVPQIPELIGRAIMRAA